MVIIHRTATCGSALASSKITCQESKLKDGELPGTLVNRLKIVSKSGSFPWMATLHNRYRMIILIEQILQWFRVITRFVSTSRLESLQVTWSCRFKNELLVIFGQKNTKEPVLNPSFWALWQRDVHPLDRVIMRWLTPEDVSNII